MLKGTTYIVRPRMQPENSSCSLPRITAGSIQLFVGPASCSRSEQMKVRSSTRATSDGSVVAQKLLGRFSGSSGTNVPASTSSRQSASYSSSDPSNQWTSSGRQSCVISSTQSSRRRFFVGKLSATATNQAPGKLGNEWIESTDHLFGAPKRSLSAPDASPIGEELARCGAGNLHRFRSLGRRTRA